MAEGIAFGIAGKIFKWLGSLAVREGMLAWGVKNEIQKLSMTVNTIRSVLLDAEEQYGRKNHAVADWLQRLKDAFYEADDLLDDFSNYLQRREKSTGNKMKTEVCIFFSKSNQITYSLNIAHKIKTIREKLNEIESDRKFALTSLDEKKIVDIEWETHSYVPAEKVIGRDDEKKEVIQLLLDSDVSENVSVVSIFGFGGLGKTALAQLVYNDARITNYFQLRMWVCVSNNFNVNVIVEHIIKSAGKKTEERDIGKLEECLREEIIKGKKYLLVLDDVWNERPAMWDNLKTLLMAGERGSKILITTRSTEVARITSTLPSYHLKALDDNKSWSLFTKIAFERGIEPKNSKIPEYGKEIVLKCGGIPLVIMTIGHSLRGNNDEDYWLHFKDNEMSTVKEKESDILPILKRSYDCLPSHLKQCFAYCALFPKDHKIKKQKLICLWMAQGFLEATDSESFEEVGNKYFMTLLSRSFFQDPQYDEWDNVVACKMHDLMRDLAKLVAGKECTLTTIDTLKTVDDKCRHVSVDCGDVKTQWKFPVVLYSAINVRSLLLFYRSNWGSNLDGGYEIFRSYGYLRVLDFGQLKFQKLLHSNGKLKSFFSKVGHLRYLNFSYMQIEKLSESITTLQNLETLDLSHCDKLKELPRGIRKMEKLRHLINKRCDSLIGMPNGLGCLTNLQTLSLFVVRQSKDSGIEELEGLNNLRAKLKIKNLKYAEKEKLANLEKKRYLWALILDWGRSDNGRVHGTDDEVTLEAQKPHPNLKKINIASFTGVKLCNWLSSLTKLTSISIQECRRCQRIPALHQLPRLKSLSLAYLDALEYIAEDASKSCTTFFPSLKELTIYHCPKLDAWWKRDVDIGSELPSFPCLCKLDIKSCPNLTFIPLYPSLEELKLNDTRSKPLEQTMMLMNKDSATLPKLKSMHMIKIPDLESLPVEIMRKLTSIVDFKVLECPKLTDQMEQAIRSLPSIQHLIIKPIEERDPEWEKLRDEIIRRIPDYSH